MLEFHGIPCFTYINIGIPRFAHVRKSWNSMKVHDLPLPLLALHLIFIAISSGLETGKFPRTYRYIYIYIYIYIFIYICRYLYTF